MFFNRSYLILIALTFFAYPAQARTEKVYDLIKSQYLETLPLPPVEEAKKPFESWNKFLVDAIEHARRIDLRTKREQFHRMLEQGMTQVATLDVTTIRDLNLIIGPATARDMQLSRILDRCATEVGRFALMSRLMRPTSDVAMLYARQEAITTLHKNSYLQDLVTASLGTLKEHETDLLALHRDDRLAAMFMRDINDERTDAKPTFFGELFKSSKYYLFNLINVVSVVAQGCTAPLLVRKAHMEFKNHNELKALWSTLHAALILHGVYTGCISLRDSKAVFIAMQERMYVLRAYINTLEQIQLLTKQYPDLAGGFESLGCIEQVLDGTDDELYQQLIDAIRSDMFSVKPSLIANPHKFTLVLGLLEKYHQRFFQGLLAIGELDLLDTCHQLLAESTEEKPWSLPTYVNATLPFFNVIDVWNPFITKRQPVLSSLSVGGLLPNTALISGPNAGGKSTVMKGCVISVLLAQTLAIAPVASMNLTPYESIITYLNIVDDIVAGNSFFKAGVIRAHEVLQEVERAKLSGGFCLVGLDEVFNGTAAEEGEAAAMALVETIGDQEHALCLSVTHFKRVTCLEEMQPDLFRNYRVSVDFDEQGSIVYRFKLEEGIADQQIAFKILEEEGFDANFLNRAKRNLEAIKGA